MQKNITNFVLLVLFALGGTLLFFIFRPFLTSIFVALILSSMFYPLFKRISKALKDRRRVASLLSCLMVFLIIIIPGVFLISLLTAESLHIYQLLDKKLEDGSVENLVHMEEWSSVEPLVDKVKTFLNLKEVDLIEYLSKVLKKISGYIFSLSSSLLKNITTLPINFLLMLFIMYYFFVDGERWLNELIYLSPLPDRYEKRIIKHFRETSSAAIKGTILTACAQGFLGGIGFLVVGLSSPLLWGTVMAFLSLIPLVGTALIWLPASLFLFFTGHWVKGIILVSWGAVVVSGSDNVIKPILIKGETELHPMLIFFSIFGGLKIFGLLGVVIGPTVIAVFLTLLEIYKEEFRDYLDAQKTN